MYIFKITFFPFIKHVLCGHSLNIYTGVYSLLRIREKVKEMKNSR